MKARLLTFFLLSFCMLAFGQGSLCPLCHKPKTKCICKPKPQKKVLTYTIGKEDRNLCNLDEKGNLVIPKTITKYGKTYIVTKIGEAAFQYCNNLTSIDIPNSATTIEGAAFYGCDNLTRVNIPNSVTKIEYSVFWSCDKLDSINIPNKLTTIGEGVFSYTKITTIKIPKNLTKIDVGAFEDMHNLTNITVDKDNPIYDSRDNCNAIIKTRNNTLISGCKNTIIPLSVTIIGDRAFYGCIDLPNINIPNNVTQIGNEAFYGCKNLTTINLPNSITAIGKEAFSHCNNLTSINIPNRVTTIGWAPFNGCSNLRSIKCYATKPPVIQSNFYEKITIHVPRGCANAYKQAKYWKESTIIDDL